MRRILATAIAIAIIGTSLSSCGQVEETALNENEISSASEVKSDYDSDSNDENIKDNFASETEVGQKCSYGTTVYGSDVHVMKSDNMPMYFYCATCARLWSEQNYFNFLDGNYWNGLLYERANGYENALNNLIYLRKVLAHCE